VALRDSAIEVLTTEPARPSWVRGHERAWQFALATVCIGAFMGQLDASIATVAVPTIQRSFGVPIGVAAWVSLAYLAALVATVAGFGRFADLHGRKLIYLYGFALFTVSSALCALAPSFPALLAFRIAQGVGAAMLQANSVAIIALAVPRERLAHSLGIQGAAQALGLAAGPSVGGLLLALGGWRLLFLVNVPAGVVALGLGWFLLPRSTDLDSRGHVDRLGLVLLVPAAGAALCAVSLAGTGALGGAVAGCLAIASIALGVAFVKHERRARSPLVDLAVLRTRALAVRLAGAGSSYVVIFGTMLAAPFLLERGLHVGVVGAGATLAAMPVAIGVTAAFAGRAHLRHGSRRLSAVGMALCTLGLVAAACAHGSASVLAAEFVVLGVGMGLFTPANNASIMGSVPRRNAGEVSGLLNMSRGVGTAVGVALTSLVLNVSATATGGFVTAMWVLAGLAVLTALSSSWLHDPSRVATSASHPAT
jgi:EmrB/QacA subfamily drug resistance transporter